MENSALPSISIVSPNYNGAEYLEDCLQSVLGQGVSGLEYVVVDGASTDGSGRIIERFAPRLSKVICEPDTGHANALNKGFAQTSGEIMGWLNSDDKLFDGTLKFVQRLFAAYPEIEWITGRATSMDLNGRVMQILPARPWSRLRFLSGDHAWIQQESTFWRRSLWERAGGTLDESLTVANDFELWMRFFGEAELHTVDRHLGCFRVRPGQRSVVENGRYREEVDRVIARELDALSPEFRAAFGHVIPDKPAELDDATKLRLQPALSAWDRPFVSPRSVNRRIHTWGSAKKGFDLASDSLESFRDKHRGERAIIMGNGPSLNQTDLTLLEGETVFASNAAFLLFPRINWRPRYFSCVDVRVLPDRASDIVQMLDENPGITAFFPARLVDHANGGKVRPTRELIPEGEGRHFFNERHLSEANLPWSMFSPDADEYVVQPHTVTVTLMQLAAYMGFSELVLVGCDTRYTIKESVELEDADGKAIALKSTEDDDPNHFDATYFGDGRRWHVPDMPGILEQYEQSRRAVEALGGRVINATVGGDLEVFERVPLEEVVSQPPQPRTKAALAPAHEHGDPAGARAGVPPLPVRLAKSNPVPVALGAIGLAASAATIAILPGLALKLAVAASAIALAAFAGTAILAWKTRRIVFQLINRVDALQSEAAAREITLVEQGVLLETYASQLDELEDALETFRKGAKPPAA
jgi:hypothetical protein